MGEEGRERSRPTLMLDRPVVCRSSGKLLRPACMLPVHFWVGIHQAFFFSFLFPAEIFVCFLAAQCCLVACSDKRLCSTRLYSLYINSRPRVPGRKERRTMT